jgi:ATP-binding cassette subfamily F protein uup
VNLVNLELAAKAYGQRALLDRVSLGVAVGDRIGVVGRNGAGKTTLLAALAGTADLDSGRSTRTGGITIGYLAQSQQATGRVRDIVFGSLPEHEWATEARSRSVLGALLSDIDMDAELGRLSGGERRRTMLAAVLRGTHDLLLLDEPTNHLDIEAIRWLAGYLREFGRSYVVVTHDRWFLDEICDKTWELADGQVHVYEGGYSAYVLARAERARVAEATDVRRRNLLRKELAWLRRGPPARTSKPKFRIEAATALTVNEPPPRDGVELTSLASARLGKTVIDLTDVTVTAGQRTLLDDVTWQLGPGDRVGVVGVNGSGKTTLLRLMAGVLPVSPDQQVGGGPDSAGPGSAKPGNGKPGNDELDGAGPGDDGAGNGTGTGTVHAEGRVRRGSTVRLGCLTQEPTPVDPALRVLEAAEQVRGSVQIGKRELSASQLLERLGLTGDRQWAPVGELSGGERRRLQLMLMLLAEPNVLLLDEPTNDLDIETLTELEDLLDGWPGSVVAVSHDRYFLERVTDHVIALVDGKLAFLPGGVDEYLALRDAERGGRGGSGLRPDPPRAASAGAQRGAAAGSGAAGGSGAARAGAPGGAGAGAGAPGGAGSGSGSAAGSGGAAVSAARQRSGQKELARLERQISKLTSTEASLGEALARSATDYARLIELGAELRAAQEERAALEERWLALAEELAG